MKYNLKEYKKAIYDNLVSRIGIERAKKAMKAYEDDFPEFYEKELSPIAASTAIIMGY